MDTHEWGGPHRATGLAGKLLGPPVSLPTRKARTCCPLVDVEIVPAMGQGARRSRNLGERKAERQTQMGPETEKERWTDRQTDTDRDIGGTEK